MMSNTASQDAALAAFQAWKDSDTGTVFGLFGGPGTGKSYLTGQLLRQMRGEIVACAPTHKAAGVLRRFLDREQIPWELGFDAYFHTPGIVVTGSTASLLGIGPVVVDDQDEELRFGAVSEGILGKFKPAWIVVDEVSMLAWDHFRDLVERCRARGTKVLIIGDPGQLPPVKAKPIPIDRLKYQALLTETMRQGADSAILRLAQALRDNEDDWDLVRGPGVEWASKRILDAFLEEVEVPTAAEEDRVCFIAYRNAVVNRAQDAACQKVYGHGRLNFEPGQRVVSESNLYRGKNELLCSNQQELVVEEIAETGEWGGRDVMLRGPRGEFPALWLPEDALLSKTSLFNLELKERLRLAKALQQEWADHKDDYALNDKRKAAWASYFRLRDQTAVSFRHPFAMTSHKSQGSTLRTVFVDARDLERYSRAGLYVAVTRPRERVVLG